MAHALFFLTKEIAPLRAMLILPPACSACHRRFNKLQAPLLELLDAGASVIDAMEIFGIHRIDCRCAFETNANITGDAIRTERLCRSRPTLPAAEPLFLACI